MTAKVKAGSATAIITPPLGTPLRGYYHERLATGVHDELQAKALYVEDGGGAVCWIACDLCMLNRGVVAQARTKIEKDTALKAEQVLISATHTHTGPCLVETYVPFLAQRIADVARMARDRAVGASGRIGHGRESGLSFNRRFWMKDGSVVTNPGGGNPDVVKPVGPIDPEVGVLALYGDSGGPFALMVNFALHLDTIGGTVVSADYSFFLTQILRRTLNDSLIVHFANGAAGDINHFDVFGRGPRKGFEEPLRIGTVLGGETIKILPRADEVALSPIHYARREVTLPLASVTDEDVAEAERILSQPEDTAHDFTMDVVWAHRVRSIHQAEGSEVATEVQVLALGDLALVGIPGELFVEYGLRIKENSPFPHTFIVELSNDAVGYLPTEKAFQEGGYEVTSSRYTPQVGRIVTEAAQALLTELSRS